MTTPPAQMNPTASASSQTAKGKPADAAAETPFSQVLSGEIAQSRRNGEAEPRDAAATRADADASGAGTSASHASAAGKADAADSDKEAADAPSLRAARPEDTALSAAYDLLRADVRPAIADPALALAIPHPAAAAGFALNRPTAEAAGDDAPSADDGIGHEPRKGALARALQAAQTEAPATTSKSVQENAARAAGFATSLASAQQGVEPRSVDPLSGLVGQAGQKLAAEALGETAATANASPATRLAPSVGTAAWGRALGEQVVWMATGGQQTASLTLNPPNLGPMQVVVNITNDQATANFFSAQPEVRQAIEAAFPRLREMMNEAGIQLGEATVSADTPRQQAFDTPAQRNAPRFGTDVERPAVDLATATVVAPRAGRGLVDTFA